MHVQIRSDICTDLYGGVHILAMLSESPSGLNNFQGIGVGPHCNVNLSLPGERSSISVHGLLTIKVKPKFIAKMVINCHPPWDLESPFKPQLSTRASGPAGRACRAASSILQGLPSGEEAKTIPNILTIPLHRQGWKIAGDFLRLVVTPPAKNHQGHNLVHYLKWGYPQIDGL